jgi:hypothetical protein
VQPRLPVFKLRAKMNMAIVVMIINTQDMLTPGIPAFSAFPGRFNFLHFSTSFKDKKAAKRLVVFLERLVQLKII